MTWKISCSTKKKLLEPLRLLLSSKRRRRRFLSPMTASHLVNTSRGWPNYHKNCQSQESHFDISSLCFPPVKCQRLPKMKTPSNRLFLDLKMTLIQVNSFLLSCCCCCCCFLISSKRRAQQMREERPRLIFPPQKDEKRKAISFRLGWGLVPVVE